MLRLGVWLDRSWEGLPRIREDEGVPVTTTNHEAEDGPERFYILGGRPGTQRNHSGQLVSVDVGKHPEWGSTTIFHPHVTVLLSTALLVAPCPVYEESEEPHRKQVGHDRIEAGA